MLVVAYHVWGRSVSGGVDVFFVLSGLLMTDSLLRELRRSGRLELADRWSRMTRRLLPPALLVLGVVVVASLLVLPRFRWRQTSGDVLAALVQVENWRLGATAVDYLASRSNASPVQHFWSLSVQWQFYLLWPVLLAAAAWWARQTGRRSTVAVGCTAAAVFAVSLGYSIWSTALRQPFAYFDTGARLWEFALGGLVAVVLPRVQLARWLGLTAGWTGLGVLVACGLVLEQAQAQFPGWAALVPTLAAVLVVVGGRVPAHHGAVRWSVSGLSRNRVVRHLSDVSFAAYLWHWPVLVIALDVSARTTPGPVGGLLVVAVSWVLAVGSRRVVAWGHTRFDGPGRAALRGRTTADRAWLPAPRGRTHGLTSVLGTSVVVVSLVWTVTVHAADRGLPPVLADPDHPGAAAVVAGQEAPAEVTARLRPSFAALDAEWLDTTGCQSSRPVANWDCEREPAGSDRPTVMVVGDSHSAQLSVAFEDLARRIGFRLVVVGMSACPFTTDPEHLPGSPAYEDCLAFDAAVAARIEDERPDLVVTTGTRSAPDSADETVPAGYRAAWERADRAGIRLVVVRDNPRAELSPSECLERAGPTSRVCDRERSTTYQDVNPLEPLVADLANVDALDTADLFCPDAICPPAVGNVLVYKDDNHLTSTYAATMGPFFDAALRDLVPWWP